MRKTARYKRDEDNAARRRKDMACAWRFLTEGEPHNCIHPTAPCSRDYDPGGKVVSFPDGSKMYEGTAIGFLYGLVGSEVHAWQTAGWNIKRRRRPLPPDTFEAPAQSGEAESRGRVKPRTQKPRVSGGNGRQRKEST